MTLLGRCTSAWACATKGLTASAFCTMASVMTCCFMDCYHEDGGKKRKRTTPDRRLFFILPFAVLLLLAGCDRALPGAGLSPDDSMMQAPSEPPRETSATVRPVVVTSNPDPLTIIAPSQPYSYTELIENGPLILDPILAYDRASQTVIRNVLETLVYPHPTEPGSYIPLLASGWRTSDDGRTYTFSIRRGVTFSNGNALTPSDVAYSLQRLVLASPRGGSQQLLLEPLLGIQTTSIITGPNEIITGTLPVEGVTTDAVAEVITVPIEVTDIVAPLENGRYVGNRAELVDNVPARSLLAICQQIQSKIVADDGEGALTIELAQPWSPFLSIMSQTWTSVIDRQWAIERGAWDGRCDTWQNWYTLESEESALADAILGTGPYILDFWAPAAEHLLLANRAYWRRDSPMWEGGPAGAPALHSVHVQYDPDAATRRQRLERGEVQAALLSNSGALLAQSQVALSCDWRTGACQLTENDDGALRRIENIPLWQQQALFFNFAIVADGNNLIGSGQLDGAGIPPDFFMDEHVRKAFAYCLDDRAFINTGLDGAGLTAPGLVPSFIFDAPSEHNAYPFSIERCREELALAWDGRLPETGFAFQLPYEAGNAAQYAAAILLQNNLRAVNSAYEVVGLALTATLMEEAVQERRAPLALVQWTPPLPDATYWLAPAFSDHMNAFQGFPADLRQEALIKLATARAANDRNAKQQAIQALNQFYAEHVPFIMLPRPSTTVHQQRDLYEALYNPADPLPYYYAYALR